MLGRHFLFALFLSRGLLGESIARRSPSARWRARSGYRVRFFEYMERLHNYDRSTFHHQASTLTPTMDSTSAACATSRTKFLPHQRVSYFEMIAITTKIKVPGSENH